MNAPGVRSEVVFSQLPTSKPQRYWTVGPVEAVVTSMAQFDELCREHSELETMRDFVDGCMIYGRSPLHIVKVPPEE
jgi:hypothetical protein